MDSSHDPTALFVVSAISLASNVALAIYQVHRIVTTRRNPLNGTELYPELKVYQKVVAEEQAAAERQEQRVPAAV